MRHDIRLHRRLAWRPGHRPAAEDVGVHVPDSLARVRAGVKDHPVALLRDAFGDCDIVGMRDDPRQQTLIGRGQLAQADVVGARDNENMYRRLRIDVTERDSPIVARHYRRRNIGGGNAAEQAGRHGEILTCARSETLPTYMVAALRTTMHHPSGATASPASGFPSPRVCHARALQ
jgi:hypothetical protein